MSRATIRLSPSDGQPPSPSSAATTPAWACPPLVSDCSSQCTAIIRPVIALYCSARRMTPAAATGRPSSVKPAAPASASAPISVNSAPSRPFVIAARKPTGTLASVAAQDVGVGDDRRRVGNREDRAVATGGRGGGARRERLLILAARRA